MVIRRILEKFVEVVDSYFLKYPGSFYNHALGKGYTYVTLCKLCLGNGKTCVRSSNSKPRWWIQYKVKDLDVANKKGADYFEIYSINPDGGVKASDICKIFTENPLSYKLASSNEFLKIFREELWY